jgi:AbrB family looped-hinge helix DNA binding protein
VSASVKMSSKNQIVVPKEAREALGLQPGDRLIVTVTGDVIEMRARPRDVVAELEGLLSGSLGADGGLWPEVRDE